METQTIDISTAAGQTWEFRPEGGDWQTIAVPAGGWRAQGHTCDAATYRTRIAIPARAAGKRVRVAFEGINFGATVWAGADEEGLGRVAEHVGGWMPVVGDITEWAAPGSTCLLQVEVLGRAKFFRDGKYLVAEGAAWQKDLEDGILRGARIELLPAVYGDDLWVRTDVEADTLTPEITLTNTTDLAAPLTLTATLSGKSFDYPAIAPVNVTLWPGETRTIALGKTPWGLGPESYWWPNVPYQAGYRSVLHNLAVRITPAGGGEDHIITSRLGFRQFQAKGAHYFLNGVRCNLRGDNQQEANFGTDAYGVHPGFGPPTPTNPGWPQAVDNLQRLNHNILRIHQVPGTQYMLDVCDELGLMIVDETPVRGSEGKEDFVGGRENMIRAARDLAMRDRRHPSIVLWSSANEIWDERGLALALQAAMLAVDDTRPVIVDGVKDLGPEIINMEHYMGEGDHWGDGLGVLPKRGGTRRTDRPYGETESVWPADNHPQGFAWMSTATRIRRLKENADIRNYVLNNAWSNYIPGHGPEQQVLEKKVKDIRWPQVEAFGMEIMPALTDPWNEPLIRLMQQSFHPFGAYDVEFDELNKYSDFEGRWPAALPQIKAGERAVRRIAVFNDSLTGGETLTLRWELRAAGDTVPGQRDHAVIRVPYGEYRIRPVALIAPAGVEKVGLWLAVERDGKTVFEENAVAFEVA